MLEQDVKAKVTTATVENAPGVATVSIRTSGEGLERLVVTINGGELFNHYPELYADPEWRDCPECQFGRATLNFCAMCGAEVPWGANPGEVD